VWGHIEPLLRKACEVSEGEFTLAGVLHNLGVNDGVEAWRLLAIEDGERVKAVMAVCITQRGDGSRSLDCLLASGDHAKEWPQVDDDFDAYAKRFGCSRVRIPRARKGWLRTLPHWRISGYFLERMLK